MPADGAIDDRIAARRREVRRDRQRRRRRRTVTVLVLLVVVAVLYAIERSPLVALEEVRVSGVERLDADEVRAAADLEPGTSTLRLRLGPASDRVRDLPLVESVTVRRLDPLTVAIEVTERRPALAATLAGQQVALDRTGVVLGDVEEVPPPSGSTQLVAPGPVPEAGERPEGGEPAGAALRTWRELTGPLRARVATLEADEDARVVLALDDGTRVLVGPADRIDEKARALGAVLEDLAGTPVEVIDVTAPSRPAVTP